MFINIHFCSKNRKSIESFLRFFSKKTFTKKLKLVIFSRTYVNLSKRNNFTMLKSPHVNKVAQEHFAYHLYRYQLKVYSYKSRSLLLFLKMFLETFFLMSLERYIHIFYFFLNYPIKSYIIYCK